jgi:DNA primase
VAAARRVGLLDEDNRERLAGRIVFPEIRRGQPTWLIGRLLGDGQDAPRYLGLPGRKCLLGWDEASRDLRGVCLVEGPLDLLALRKWGVPGLALCGTRPHPEILAALGRWRRLYAALDADPAGQAATARLVEAFGERVVPVSLPAGAKDPADLAVRPDGDALFAAAIQQAVARIAPGR